MTAWGVLTALVGVGEVGLMGFWWWLARRERARALEVFQRNARIDRLVDALRARDEEMHRVDAAGALAAGTSPPGAVRYLRDSFPRGRDPGPVPAPPVARPAGPDAR